MPTQYKLYMYNTKITVYFSNFYILHHEKIVGITGLHFGQYIPIHAPSYNYCCLLVNNRVIILLIIVVTWYSIYNQLCQMENPSGGIPLPPHAEGISMGVYGSLCMSTGVYGCLRVAIRVYGVYGNLWINMSVGVYGYLWEPMGVYGCLWESVNVNGNLWVCMVVYG